MPKQITFPIPFIPFSDVDVEWNRKSYAPMHVVAKYDQSKTLYSTPKTKITFNTKTVGKRIILNLNFKRFSRQHIKTPRSKKMYNQNNIEHNPDFLSGKFIMKNVIANNNNSNEKLYFAPTELTKCFPVDFIKKNYFYFKGVTEKWMRSHYLYKDYVSKIGCAETLRLIILLRHFYYDRSKLHALSIRDYFRIQYMLREPSIRPNYTRFMIESELNSLEKDLKTYNKIRNEAILKKRETFTYKITKFFSRKTKPKTQGIAKKPREIKQNKAKKIGSYNPEYINEPSAPRKKKKEQNNTVFNNTNYTINICKIC